MTALKFLKKPMLNYKKLKTKYVLSIKQFTLTLLTIPIISLTALYGQTGSEDTLTCYTNDELKKIASRVVRASECDTLLNIAEQQLTLATKTESTLRDIISKKDTIIRYKTGIVLDQNHIIHTERENIKALKKKLTWTKVGWFATTLGLLGLTLAILI